MSWQRAALVFAEQVADVVDVRLGEALVGVYGIGSMSRNDVGPTSDVDVVVVAGRAFDTSPVVDDVVAAAASCRLRGVEMVCYLGADLRPPRHPLPYLLNVNAGPGMETHVSTSDDPPHWLLLDIAGSLGSAIALRGPPLTTVADEPARSDVLQALLASLRWHREHDVAGVNAVLNACRSLCFAQTGQWLSKSAAGARIVGDGGPPVVADALRQRQTGVDSALDARDVRAFVDQVEAAVGAS